MLEIAETNTYVIQSAKEVADAAFLEQLDADFKSLTGPDLSELFGSNVGQGVEFLGANSPEELLLPSAKPIIYTVMINPGPFTVEIDPAIAGTSIGPAGIQPNPGALGMHVDCSGLPPVDRSKTGGDSDKSDDGDSDVAALAPKLGIDTVTPLACAA